jgi:hypothetical protein
VYFPALTEMLKRPSRSAATVRAVGPSNLIEVPDKLSLLAEITLPFILACANTAVAAIVNKKVKNNLIAGGCCIT